MNMNFENTDTPLIKALKVMIVAYPDDVDITCIENIFHSYSNSKDFYNMANLESETIDKLLENSKFMQCLAIVAFNDSKEQIKKDYKNDNI